MQHSDEVTNINNVIFNDLIGKYLDTGQVRFYEAAYKKLFDISVAVINRAVDGIENYSELPTSEDIAQNFWMDVFEGKYKAFNMIVSLNEKVVDELRRANALKRGGGHVLVGITKDAMLDFIASDSKDPQHWAEVDDQVRQVHEYIEALPKERKLVCKLGLVEGVTQTEMQNEYGIAQPFASRVLKEETAKIKELLTNEQV